MTCIPCLIAVIQRNQFRYIYLYNKNVFVDSFVDFENLHQISTFSKKDDPHSLCISDIWDSEIRS